MSRLRIRKVSSPWGLSLEKLGSSQTKLAGRYRTGIWLIRFVIWVIVFATGLFLFLRHYPFEVERRPDTSGGVEFERETPSDVLIVLDYRAIQDAGESFEDSDWSAAWINTFQQELGGVAVSTPRTLTSTLLKQARVIVLTASVTGHVPDEIRSRLKQFTLKGGTLVLERPAGAIRDRYAADGEGGVRQAHSLSYVGNLGPKYRKRLMQMPLYTEYRASRQGLSDAKTLLAMDGAPVVYRQKFGRGRAIIFDFDVGQQLVGLQQGDSARPVDRTAPDTAAGDVSRTSELVFSKQMTGAKTPYADLLERFIVHGVLGASSMAVGIWPFPEAKAGAAVLTHEVRNLDRNAFWMRDVERDYGVGSTFLFDSGFAPGPSDKSTQEGADAGLLWRRQATPHEQRRRLGGQLDVFSEPMTLSYQLNQLEGSGIDPGPWARVSGYYWNREGPNPWGVMSAAGLAVDSTLGAEQGGYDFGTGFSFYPIAPSGLPYDIRELPVIVSGLGESVDKLEAFLDRSSNGYHQTLTWNVNPGHFARHPSASDFEEWKRGLDAIVEADHLGLGIGEHYRIQRARRESSIGSSLQREAKVVVRPEKEQKSSDRKGALTEPETKTMPVRLRLTVNVGRSDLFAMVPVSYRGHDFAFARESVNRMGGQVVGDRIDTIERTLVGYDKRLLPLAKGQNRIDVYYR